jgi:hypothetical protein
MAYFRAGDRIERPCPQGRCGGDLIVVREQIPVRAVDAGTAFPVERKHLVRCKGCDSRYIYNSTQGTVTPTQQR